MNLLQKSGAIHVVVCLDGDSAGRKGTEGIVKKLDQLFNVRTVELPDEADIGSMTSENVRNLLVPVLQSFGERGTKALTEIAR
jgi:DNA primase